MSTTKTGSATKKTTQTPEATAKATESDAESDATDEATTTRAVADRLGSVYHRAASTAGTAGGLLRARKSTYVAAGAGAAVAGTAAYAAGRRSRPRRRGALSRLTGGRL